MLYARLGKQMQLHGGGYSIRSFIHMDDVADATYRIAIDGVAGDSYHISTRETVSVRDLVEKIADLTRTPFKDLVQVSEERLGKDQAYQLESSKIRQDLNWSDRVSLDDGLKETLAWVDKNLEVLRTLPADYIHKP
jgi:dTDP-glucose 4,6-dehydratase